MSLPTAFKMDVLAENGTAFRVVFLPFGGSENYPAVKETEPLVEFYDLRYSHTPDGQFTGCRTTQEDILNRHPFRELSLQGDVPAWTVDGDTFSTIHRWLRTFEVSPQS
ncbi:hypothetical protein PP460_gp055 [Streptomyces phage Muntaha]|uniref:Uncharacterized protein n=1 Tax=Streptomyces phage Muntaha TaxID=2713269 RepID=A0A6G8R3G8_9CAUD|nr:hypothetical protein PP460_gp055 [Streptomyces phage Muntaha]QIN94747.1 hypothetical protein SEA_MUNTAHA_223 [Streptomyces phage Muntaha]